MYAQDTFSSKNEIIIHSRKLNYARGQKLYPLISMNKLLIRI